MDEESGYESSNNGTLIISIKIDIVSIPSSIIDTSV
jgi:hypothetical protein